MKRRNYQIINMSIYITLFLFLISLVLKRSKYVAVLFFIFMWTLWGWNTWNGDYDAYLSLFEQSSENLGEYERGYTLLNSLFLNMGFDFQGFMICFSFLVLSPILYIAIKSTNYPALFSVLYFFIFIQEFVFMRNYLSNSLFFIALWLAFIQKKQYKYYYLGIILFSSLFHSTSIMFLIFLPALKGKLLNVQYIIFYAIIAFAASICMFDLVLPLLGTNLIDKYTEYATGGYITNTSFAHLIIVVAVYKTYKIFLKDKYLPVCSKRICTIIVNINLLSIFYLCLYYHVPYFASRFLRCLSTIDLLFFVIVLFYVHGRWEKTKVRFLFTIFVAYIVLNLLTDTLPYTIIPLYRCNLLWGNEYYIPIL